MPRTIPIYATRSDLIQLCEAAERENQLTYSLIGNLVSIEPVCYHTASDIPELGISRQGALLFEPSYLVLERATPITVFTMKRTDGSDIYFVGQQQNPDSIDFQPGGIYKDQFIIQGAIGSISRTSPSAKLYKLFQTSLRKYFAHVQGTYVGPEAFQFNAQGGRLTQSIKLPAESDFKIAE